jgi:hypothetical protein
VIDNTNPPIEGTLLEVARESRSSIELSRDAKGVYRWDIKIYFDAQEDDENGVVEQVRRLDARLRRLFLPTGDPA